VANAPIVATGVVTAVNVLAAATVATNAVVIAAANAAATVATNAAVTAVTTEAASNAAGANRTTRKPLKEITKSSSLLFADREA